MAIKPIGNAIIPVKGPEKRPETTKGTLSFEQVLQETTRNKTEGSAPMAERVLGSAGSEVSGPFFAPLPPLALGPRELSVLQRQGVEAAERTLDLLEAYEGALAGRPLSTKGLESLIESLSEETRNLSDLAQELPPTDPLQKLVTEVGVLSAVTVWKHKEGVLL